MANEQHLHPAVKKRMAREHAKAVKTAEEAVASARASYGEEHPQVAVALANLGKLHQGHSEFAQAETALTQALVIREKRPSDAAGLAGSLRDLARLHDASGQGEKARPLMQRAARVESEAFLVSSPTAEAELPEMEYSASAEFVENMAGSAPKSFWAQTWGGLVLPVIPLIIGLVFLVRGRIAIYGHRGHIYLHGPLIVEGPAARMWGLVWLCAAAFAHFHFFWPYRNRVLCSYGKAVSFVAAIILLFAALAKMWMG